jgi:hypothetical protein
MDRATGSLCHYTGMALTRRCTLFLAVVAGTGVAATPHSLYVATQNQIFVYSLGATTPRLTISTGLAGVTQIAIDKAATRYASNFGTAPSYVDSSVTEYLPGNTSPTLTRTNGAFSASGVAVDSSGNVYVSSYYPGMVSEYHAGAADPFLQISGLNGPGLLACGHTVLYVGLAGSAQILRFPSGATSPDLTLTVKAPGSLPGGALTYGGPFVVTPKGTVYAGGAVIASDLGYEEFVDVFAPGASSPSGSVVLSMGSNAQSPPYVSVGIGGLYASASDINSVFQYSNGRLVRTITNGLNQPGPLAVDGSGQLYVGNAGGTVTVYPPSTTSPSQTIIIPGFAAPVAVEIAP